MTDDELNAAVAREVMGWQCGQSHDYVICGVAVERPHRCDGRIVHWYPWSPATDIAAAFEVVERMREWGWVFAMGDQFPEVFARFYRCDKVFRADVPMHPNGEARAICEAALAAVRAIK